MIAVYHPTEPGDYAVIFFVPGLGGLVPSFLYDNFVANVSTHGYIVASSAWIVPPFGDQNGDSSPSAAGHKLQSLFPRESVKNPGLQESRSDTYWKILLWVGLLRYWGIKYIFFSQVLVHKIGTGLGQSRVIKLLFLVLGSGR